MTGQLDDRSAQLPPGVKAWISPGERIDYVTRHRRGMQITSGRLFILVAVSLVPIFLLAEVYLPAAMLAVAVLLGLFSRGAAATWLTALNQVVVLTDRRVLIVGAMGPRYVSLGDIESVSCDSEAGERTGSYGTVEINTAAGHIRVNGVDRPCDLVGALSQALGRADECPTAPGRITEPAHRADAHEVEST